MLATKLDASTEPARLQAVERLARERGLTLMKISSASGLGLPELIRRTGELVDDERAREMAGEGRVVVHRPIMPKPILRNVDEGGEDE